MNLTVAACRDVERSCQGSGLVRAFSVRRIGPPVKVGGTNRVLTVSRPCMCGLLLRRRDDRGAGASCAARAGALETYFSYCVFVGSRQRQRPTTSRTPPTHTDSLVILRHTTSSPPTFLLIAHTHRILNANKLTNLTGEFLTEGLSGLEIL